MESQRSSGVPEERLPITWTQDTGFTSTEVERAVHQMKHNKALGSSWLSPELLQYHKDKSVYEAITLILNQACKRGIPPSWNTLQVTSLHKKGDPMDPGNYRGISVMSCLPKLLAMVILNRLEETAEQGGLRAST